MGLEQAECVSPVTLAAAAPGVLAPSVILLGIPSSCGWESLVFQVVVGKS